MNMKKTILITMMAVCSMQLQAQFSGQGSGTEKDPYKITNADELFEVRNDLAAYYKVMNDIDMTEWIQEESPKQGWTPIGTETSPFTGTFDGNSMSIIGLYINKPNVDNVGMFGYIKGGTIKNSCLVNPNITGHNSVGSFLGGGLSTQYYCINDNVCIGGIITGNLYVGGIVGRISDIDETSENFCYLKGNYSSSHVIGDDYCGGIVGEVCGYVQKYNSAYTHINNYCYPYIYDNHFAGTIEGKSSVGGIAGREANPKNNWYYGSQLQMETRRNLVRGVVSGKNNTNGIIGIVDDYKAPDLFVLSNNICALDTITGLSPNRIFSEPYADNYSWTSTVVIRNGKVVDVDDDNCNGSSLGTKTLMRKNTYVGFGFDFSNQWAITEGESFPYNIHQCAPGKVMEFTGGSRGKISGTAEGTGNVYVFVGDKMYKSYIVDGQWEVILGNTPSGTIAKVSVATGGLMPSVFVIATAEESSMVPTKSPGDANVDGVVDSADVTAIINYILGKPSASFNKENADVTGDGEILIDDAVQIVQMIMDAQ